MVELVPPQRVRYEWPAVRAGLDSLCTRFPQDWIPEDVYAACVNGRATLHLVRVGGDVAGFFVLEQTQEFGIDSLHMWVMWHAGDTDVYPEVMDYVKACAARINARRIRFSTLREGWARRLGEGWRPGLQFWEFEL